MTEVVAAVGDALRADGSFVAVTGRSWQGLEPVVEAAGAHLVAPGPSTRVTIGQGAMLAGHPAVVLVDDPTAPPTGDAPLAVTVDPACASAAMTAGWKVVQPFAAADVARLIEIAAPARIVLPHHGPAEPALEPPRTASRRQWAHGELGTLAASGAGVGVATRLVQRLRSRGVDVSLVEVAVLDDARQRVLLGGATILVCPAEAADALRRGQWPAVAMEPVEVDGVDEVDLIGAVLARVPTAH